MLVMFFSGVRVSHVFSGGVRVGHVFWWGSCWSCFLVGSVLVMFFGGVRFGHVFSFMCCPIMCLYVLSSML